MPRTREAAIKRAESILVNFMVFLLIARCQNGALLQKELPEACQKYIFPAISERYKLKKMRSVRDLFLLR
ncbi:MAG: hypothetical protein PUK52_03265, partial [Desulfovibrio sp.]|nr:hypothetical protein [Desulfovibrio sp.]